MPGTSAFFAAVRPLFGGSLSQQQVDGINLVLDAWPKYGDGDDRHLAYILATDKHETASTMQPIREYGRGKNKPYGKIDETGKAPYGRGLAQLTWRENYVRADRELGLGGRLAADYDLALDPQVAVRILITGMLEGWFTTKKLSDYRDFKDMRRVVNGTDKASLIADYADSFLRAIQAQEWTPYEPAAPTGLAGLLAAIFKFIVNLFTRKDR